MPARRHWTLMIVPDGDTEARQMRVSRGAVRLASAAAILVLGVLAALSTGFVVRESQQARAVALARENVALEGEMVRLRERMGELEVVLGDLWDQDEQYRLLAGLDPLDDGVRRVGIGGPGSEAGPSDLEDLDPRMGRLARAASTNVSTMVRRAQLLSTSWREASRSLAATNERLRATPSILPAEGRISSAFSHSRLHPILDVARPHKGVDVTARHGTPIVATAAGRVTFVGRQGSYGQMVEVDHGYGVRTRYAHASKLLVRRGQRVERGETIAEVGSSGLSAAPHVHYEVWVSGRPINPRRYILESDVLPD
jgi:murein DD-endopeptidase MepM/ murein hydrolase activator NlpD